MDVRTAGLLALVCLIPTGCQQNPYSNSQVEAMRAEVLLREDELYALDSDYRNTMDKLNGALAENNQLRTRLGMSPQELQEGSGTRIARPLEGDRPDGPAIDLGSPLEPIPARPDRASTQPPPRHFAVAPVSAVYLDDMPPQAVDPPTEAAATPAPDASHSALLPESNAAPPEELVNPSDMRVTHIILHPTRTTGHDFDRKAGDDGISILLQPRNAENQFVPSSGELSIVVLDAEQQGQRQRVASWTVDKKEMGERFDPSLRGYQFRLPWPDGTPEHNNLHLFVRYVNEQGERLEADMELAVALPGTGSNRWTPKAGRSRPSTNSATSTDPPSTVVPSAVAPSIVANRLVNGETITMSKILKSTVLKSVDDESRNVASGASFNDGQRAASLPRPSWRPTR